MQGAQKSPALSSPAPDDAPASPPPLEIQDSLVISPQAQFEEIRNSLHLILEDIQAKPSNSNITYPAISADSLLQILQDSESLSDIRRIARLLQNPEIQQHLLKLIGDSSTDLQVLKSLSRLQELGPAFTSAALPGIFAKPEFQKVIQGILQESAAHEAISPQASQVLRLLSRPEMVDAAQEIFQSAPARAVLIQVLAAYIASSPNDPLASEATPAALATPAPSDSIPDRLPIQAQEILDTLLSASDPKSLSNTQPLSNLLRALSDPAMADLAREIFSTPQARNLLTRVLAEFPQSTGLPTSDSVNALRILSLPQLNETALFVFSQPRVQAQIPQYLLDPQTSRLMLQILAQPVMQDIAAKALSPESVPNSLDPTSFLSQLPLRRENFPSLAALLGAKATSAVVLQELANTPPTAVAAFLSYPKASELLPNLIVQTETRELALRMLAQPGMNRILDQPEILAAILTSLKTPEALPQLHGILSNIENQPILDRLIALAEGPSQGNSPEIRAFLLGMRRIWMPTPEQATAPVASDTGVPISGPDRIPSLSALLMAPASSVAPDIKTKISGILYSWFPELPADRADALASIFLRLLDISPERAGQAARILELIGNLKPFQSGDALIFISHKLESLANALAQKGGLPLRQIEPDIAENLVLMLRFGQATPLESRAVFERLADLGMEITFAGRDTAGNLQIHLSLAPSRSKPSDIAAPGQNDIAHINLQDTEKSKLASLWPQKAFLPSFIQAEPLASATANSGQSHQHDSEQDSSPQRSLTNPSSQSASAQQLQSPQQLAGLLYWKVAALPELLTRVKQQTEFVEDAPVIPSMLDLVRAEPLLLTYDPGELMIPGTTIPLIRREPDDEVIGTKKPSRRGVFQ